MQLGTLQSIPPEVDTIKTLVKVSGILALVFGIILLIIGLATLLFGVFLLIPGIIDILIYVIYVNCKEIIRLVEMRNYQRAKEKTHVWMIMGFIFGGIVIGLLLLAAYLKYDEVLRRIEPREIIPA